MSEYTLKQIEVFAKVVETGSFTKASQELYITQSTASAHIAALEEALGTKLLSRQARRAVSLTPDGEKIYPQVKRILGECSHLEEMVEKEESTLPLQLGASTVPGQYILPKVMTQYLKKQPQCKYVLRRGDSAAIHKMVLDGEIRMGLVGAMLDANNMNYLPLAEDKLVMVTPNNERYRQMKKDGVYGRQLLGEPTIARELGSGTDRAVQGYMMKIGYAQDKLNIVARVEEPEIIKSMIVQGLGVSILSNLAIVKEEEEGKVLSFDLDEKEVHRDVYLIYRKGTIFKSNEEKFINFLTSRKYH